MSESTWDNDAVFTGKTANISGTATVGTLAVTTVNALSIAGTQTFTEGTNIATGTATGTQFGTTVTQKVGFWGQTPIVQPVGAGQGVVTALTDNSGGSSGGNTIAVVTDNTSAANAIATLAAKVNAVNVLVTAIRLGLVNSGLLKGSA